MLDGAALATKAAASRHEDAEQNALQPRAQVGVGLVLILEAEGALEGVLQHVLGDGVVAG